MKQQIKKHKKGKKKEEEEQEEKEEEKKAVSKYLNSTKVETPAANATLFTI